VFSQFSKPVWACAKSAHFLCICVGVCVFVASSALGSTISVGTLNNWQWNGFTRTSFSKSKTAANSASSNSVTTISSKKSAAVSASSLTYSALSANSTDSQSGSLAGLVFYDANANGKIDSSDWAIFDAKVTLKWDTGSSLVAYTGSDGAFRFTGLSAGTYSVNLGIDDSDPGQNLRGTMTDADGKSITTGLGTVHDNSFSDIVLGDGYKGINYTFTQLAYPASLITKRLYTISNNGVKHTPESPVPEPGSLVLLTVAGMSIGGIAWRRCRKQRG